jgi:toxin ParE1/3/4
LAKIELSEQAELDLIDIWAYIARDSTTAADNLIDQVATVCQLLAKCPLLGRTRTELAPGLRSFSVGDYLIFYRPSKNGIAIARILSGYRNLDALFEPE